MNRIRIGRPRARSERPWPGALSPDPRDPGIVRAKGAHADRAFRKGGRDVIAWAGRCLWLAVRMVIRAVRMTHDEQVRMWECVLLTSGAAPLSAAGPLRWVPSLGGNRLVGSHLPAQDPSGRAYRRGSPSGCAGGGTSAAARSSAPAGLPNPASRPGKQE
jgi:hypothetical protein